MIKRLFYIFLTIVSYCISAQYKTNSVLSEGKWVKIKIEKTGIYKIPLSTLKDMGFSSIDNIRIYGYGGTILTEKVGQNFDDLPETPIKIYDNCVYFYGKSAEDLYFNTKITHSQNIYSKYAYYFVTEKANGRKLENKDFSNYTSTFETNYYNYYSFQENELSSLLMRGKKWMGEEFSSTNSSHSFSFETKNRISGSPISVNFALAGRMTTAYYEYYSTKFKYTINDSTGYIQMPQIYGSTIITKSETISYTPKNTDLLSINLNYSYNNTEGYVDYISIQTKCSLLYSGEQLRFRNIDSKGKTTKYNIISEYSDLNIWKITKPDSVNSVISSFNNNNSSLKYYSNSIEDFIAFRYSDAFNVTSYETISNQNLHNYSFYDYLIVTPKEFYTQAERLADFHRNKDSLKVLVATTDQIYNEFSSGRKDVMGIKNFVKLYYDKANLESKKLKHLLLFSDATYDPRGNLGIAEIDKLIPSYNSDNLDIYGSYMCDDYYGFLDNVGDESILSTTSTIDIGIGRIPANTVEQAKNYVDKLYNFSTNNGIWKNTICLLADDADDIPDYMINSEECSKIIDNYPEYNQKKIYEDAYPEISTSSEERYPEASSDLIKSINNGALITSYMGHGSASRLAHETLIDLTAIAALKNKNQGLWITGTCDFAPIFEHEITSSGEELIMNKNGGALDLLTTTIISYQNINSAICKNFFTEWTNNNETTIGEITRRCKNKTKESLKTFILLGDPALKLVRKTSLAEAVTINDSLVKNSGKDTLSTLKEIVLKGNINKSDNKIIDSTFNGTIYFSVYDKANSTKTLGNDGYVMTFYSQENVISKGQTEVKNGKFEINFIIPKDISTKDGLGKINFYTTKSDSSCGYNGSLLFATKLSDSISEIDIVGPEIKLYLDDTTFTSGQKTGASPVVKIYLNDESGINTSTFGIGHELLLTLDNKTEFVLNDYYQGYSVKKGTIEYQLSNLEEGLHSLNFKAFDIYNNSSTKTINFNVKNELDIMEVFNYPNPVVQENYLKFKHNKINSTFNIYLEVLDLLGTKIACEEYKDIVVSSNYYKLDISELSTNLNSGIYMIKVRFTSVEDSQTSEKIIKILKK